MTATRLTTRDWRGYVPVLQARGSFRTGGSLYGIPYPGLVHLGQMDRSHQDMLRTLLAQDRLAYVVYSYETPIAWCDSDGCWTLNRNRYSPTTTRHQKLIANAIDLLG